MTRCNPGMTGSRRIKMAKIRGKAVPVQEAPDHVGYLVKSPISGPGGTRVEPGEIVALPADKAAKLVARGVVVPITGPEAEEIEAQAAADLARQQVRRESDLDQIRRQAASEKAIRLSIETQLDTLIRKVQGLEARMDESQVAAQSAKGRGKALTRAEAQTLEPKVAAVPPVEPPQPADPEDPGPPPFRD